MLDLAGIMFSSMMILLVIVRAVQLDRDLPWFRVVKSNAGQRPAAQRIRQRPS